eukprot:Plantae.Rhodophyta-Palmaria_palmata.ctg12989.p1 GENE.Plantae.Rhodophyta-Palmaria_palmata.ctg12989~~Plantae.Rhodophyta-Palmaria_palmata.ctg12989.p1  ORF type:complete len:211 (-),score=21.19 Plantae.Rhodophyta-Palmaria_palmata.ctg12989:544-1176(-)
MGEVTSDRTKVAKLLTSVPEEYSSISAALRTQVNDERTWNEVQDLMQDEYERLDQIKSTRAGRSSGSKVLYSKEQRRNVVCHNCKKKGHIRKYCKSKPAHEDPADDDSNSNDTESHARDRGTRSRSSARKAGSSRVKLLMARSNTSSDGTAFVLDSGASRHMVTTPEILCNVHRGSKHDGFTASGQRMEGELYGDLKLILSTPNGDTTDV